MAIGTFSGKLARLPGLEALLGERPVHLRSPWYLRPAQRARVRAVVGWGQRPSTQQPRAWAARRGLPFIALEDGFLRSWGTGSTHPGLSLVVDEQGIYYDATQPSALESLLASGADLLAGAGADHARARSSVVRARLGKYNFAPDWQGTPPPGRARVLVVDQTVGDASIRCGLATSASFTTMLHAARRENPGACIYVKTHPEVSDGAKRGHYGALTADANTVLLREAVNPYSLLAHMDRVYVVTSHLGFEALLAGVPVTCFGMPWYAGWGATDDRASCPRRGKQRTVAELFAAAYLHYTRYLNPYTHARGSIFDVIDWLVHQRRMTQRLAGRSIAIGYRRWKAENVHPFLALPPCQPHFVADAGRAAALQPGPQDRLIVWGADPAPEIAALARRSGAALLRMEDGFIRSVGLGSDFVPPQSLVLDASGLYFDPRQSSDLEDLLNTHAFTAPERQRAARVRALIVAQRISKYNVEAYAVPAWRQTARRTVLVPGQVEDDASIRHGCGDDVHTNLALLRAVRAACPDAFIVYKPHPDVAAGKRRGAVRHGAARQYTDAIETRLSALGCIAACDAVHTMTSLTGFDALLRGKQVSVYGRPFYAGWGLTEDKLPIPRRARTLTLDELVAAALLHYPLYWDWTLQGFTTCEATILTLVRQRGMQRPASRLWSTIKHWVRAGFLIKG